MVTCEDCRFRDKLECAYRPPVVHVVSQNYTPTNKWGDAQKGEINTNTLTSSVRPTIGEAKTRQVKSYDGWGAEDFIAYKKACVFHRKGA